MRGVKDSNFGLFPLLWDLQAGEPQDCLLFLGHNSCGGVVGFRSNVPFVHGGSILLVSFVDLGDCPIWSSQETSLPIPAHPPPYLVQELWGLEVEWTALLPLLGHVEAQIQAGKCALGRTALMKGAVFLTRQ